jgi:hypothetical protein
MPGRKPQECLAEAASGGPLESRTRSRGLREFVFIESRSTKLVTRMS